MGHVAIPSRWKEFLFHRGCSSDMTSIHRARLIVGGKGKEGRQAVFFTPLTCFFVKQSRRRRIQQRRIEAWKSVLSWQMEASSGRCLLDPLGQGTRKVTIFWQTRSHAINDHDSVPADWRRQILKSETLHAWASSEDRSQECLEIEATAATQQQDTKRSRETACGATPKANQQARQTQE